MPLMTRKEELHRLSVYETDPPREEDATPECRKRTDKITHSATAPRQNCKQQPSAHSYTRRSWALKSRYHTR